MGEVSHKVDNQKQCAIDPTVQPTSSYVKNNKVVASAEETNSTCSLHGNDATQASLLAVSVYHFPIFGNILHMTT